MSVTHSDTDTDAGAPAAVLEAPNVLEFPYTRSTGPVIGAFMTGLRDGVILGVRTPSGRVVVPPTEYDPETGEEIGDLVEVGTAGEVTAWAWVHHPRDKHLMDRPFAWALVKLDGADTAMLHMLDAPGPDAVTTGMRVAVRWRTEREGHIKDIECFVPESRTDRGPGSGAAPVSPALPATRSKVRR